MVDENGPRCGNYLSRTSCATPYTNIEKTEEKSKKSGIGGEPVQEMEVTVESGQCEGVEVGDDDQLDVYDDQKNSFLSDQNWESLKIRSDTVNPSDRTSCRAYLPN